ncbi:MAG: S8 family peptidase [Actinomycetota bacterium]|nr:S8 family peptidase [Actinomycetota bacterium]
MQMTRVLTIAVLGAAAAAGWAAPGAAADDRFEVLLRGSHAAAAHASAAGAVLARAGARRAGPRVPEIGLETVAPPPGGSVAKLLRALRGDPRVRAVYPVQRLSLRAVPNDPALAQAEGAPGTPAGTVLQWPYVREGLDRLWDISHGDGALVGLIDTGTSGGHPDLAGKIAAGVDQNGDDNLPPDVDTDGHGTHVGSLACGAVGNGAGIAGAGGNCGLVVERTDLTNTSVAASIVDATNRGVQAINLSLGGPGGRPPDGAFVSAIDYAYQHNVVVVAAASDFAGTDQGQPASLLQPTGTGPDLSSPEIKGLSVTAASFGDGPSGGGSGSQISLAAYGSFSPFDSGGGGPRGLVGAFPPTTIAREQIDFSVFPPRAPCGCRTSVGGDNRFGYLQGTSMATPQVAGVAAVVRVLNPLLSAAEVIRLLKQTARRPPGTGWTPALGWGILDGGAAADAARRIDRQAPTSRLRAPHVAKTRRFILRWSGGDPSGAPALVPSGIAFFDVYASRDGKRLHRIGHTTKRRISFTGRRGSSYRFFLVAVDRAGNREARPARPKATTRVAAASKPRKSPKR